MDEVDRQDLFKTLAEACQRTGWHETDLVWRRRHDPGKLAVARPLRKEATLSVKQIAIRLHLSTTRSASVCLLAASRAQAPGDALQGSLGI